MIASFDYNPLANRLVGKTDKQRARFLVPCLQVRGEGFTAHGHSPRSMGQTDADLGLGLVGALSEERESVARPVSLAQDLACRGKHARKRFPSLLDIE